VNVQKGSELQVGLHCVPLFGYGVF